MNRTQFWPPILAIAISLPSHAAEPTDTLPGYDKILDEIVVTATRAPKLLKDVPVHTILITSKEIEKADATNIEELLQQEMPGIEFSYAMNQQVHMNFGGFGGQGVLFLVNGERLAGETMDDVDFTRMNMANIDRIEIVKGASGAIYGSNAGGGVINIITKEATRPWDISLNARIARHNEQRYNLTLSNRYKALGNSLTASFYSIDNYDVNSAPDPPTRVFTTVYGNRTWNFKDELTFRPLDGLKLTAHAGYFFRQRRERKTPPNTTATAPAACAGNGRSGTATSLTYPMLSTNTTNPTCIASPISTYAATATSRTPHALCSAMYSPMATC